MDKMHQLREEFPQLGVDGLLITNPQNRLYFTGFTGTAGVALISANEAVFLTDYRYVEQVRIQTKGYEIIELQNKAAIYSEVAKAAKRMGITKLGFEQEHMTCGIFSRYKEVVQVEMVPTCGVIETFRMIKTPHEIELLRAAARIADAAFQHILGFIRPGVTELEVSNALEAHMRQLGASSSSFNTIVASGLRSALPHGVATNKIIEKGEMVTLDFGAVYEGYRSDLTRTIAVGTPSDEMRHIYDIVLTAQLQSIAGMKPGIHGKELDAISRNYIADKGYGAYGGNGAGHGIGLDLWEEPFISQNTDKNLQPGMVITMEPGIYVPNVGGVRIEDDVLITENDHEVLTHSPKELIIL
ncbi:M24 family metallopeptidase [Paenibacillus sp. KN14-4R]|uniref:M24 family metallopeptidase n=1 Tax=Paenibacillus sp. KN14-4R TaxID=3445773 RepID=UPI003FA137AF